MIGFLNICLTLKRESIWRFWYNRRKEVSRMSEKEMLEKILQITQQTQQSIQEIRENLVEINERRTKVNNLEERVKNIENNMARQKDLMYYTLKIAEHDREIFGLKQN
jgi:hypothetical protein